MKAMCILIVVFTTLANIGGTTTNDPLSPLRDAWGRGSVADFRKLVYSQIPLVFKESGSAAIEQWCLELIDYPDLWEETASVNWMEAKASALSYCIGMRFLDSSTNCWFAAAGLLDRYRVMASDAASRVKDGFDYSLMKTDPKQFNEIYYGSKSYRIKARNLKHAETFLARVVTNEFPAVILPSLPQSERSRLLSGLAYADNTIAEVGEDNDRCSALPYAVYVILLLAGCPVVFYIIVRFRKILMHNK